VVGVMTSMSSVVSVSRRNISGRILPKNGRNVLCVSKSGSR
jgi:hypothetical protein